MNNETKRDVFEVALNHATKTGWVDYGQLSDRYAAAFPDDMPVIPKSWADTIEEYKANHYRLEKIFTDALILNYDEQDVVARAWLDGYQVEVSNVNN